MLGDGDYSDEEDDFSTSDSDLSVSDEGGSAPPEPPTAEDEREYSGVEDKGKAVMEISDDNALIENEPEAKESCEEDRGDLDLLAKVSIEDGKKGKESPEKDTGDLDFPAELCTEDERESKRIRKDEPGSKEIREEDKGDLDLLADLCVEDENKSKRSNEEDRVCSYAPEKKEGTERVRPILKWRVWEEENERWIDAHETKDTESDNEDEEMDEIAMNPPDLLIPLLRFQKEWLAWALKQEKSEMRGGILADEIRMGKTIQAIALVLAKRGKPQLTSRTGGSSPPPSSSLVLPETKCTLVICPTDAILQWESEIIAVTPIGSMRLSVYYGRKKSSDGFFESDFVLTTYSTLAAEYRKVMPTKKKVKSSGLEAETSQCKKQQENPAGIHHGAASRNSVLLSVKWNRIILDEAHCIKNKHRSTAKAVFALESSYKWALSGTALQVHVGELYSLVRFLQITPYSYFFCMECDCESLEYSSKRKCNCVHSTAHFLWWKRYISQPILALEDNISQHRNCRRAMILLKKKLLKSIALRRTMKGRAAEISFPPKLVLLRRDIIVTGEEDYYKALHNKSLLQFNRYAAYGTISNNFMQVIQLLTKLRQAAAHPYLALFPQAEARKSRYTSTLNYDGKTCNICLDVAEDPVVTSCKHVFCKDCFIDYSAALGEDSCPKKSATTRVKGTKRSSFINRICLEQLQTSTKVEALSEEICNMFQRDGSAKGVVFSQFISFLDLLYHIFKPVINCVQYVGTMNLAARRSALWKFNNDPDCKIIFVSLKAGAVLKQIEASHIFLMDPSWNSTEECQAIDRIHYQMAQHKPVLVIRFINENTIEEKILKLQEMKPLMFQWNGGGSPKDLRRLTEDDLRDLFKP